MKLVWSPDKACKAYITTVKTCKNFKDTGVSELLSAMAAGWNTKMIVETWSRGNPTATSIGIAVAATCTGGRHVCVVPDERSMSEYLTSVLAAVPDQSTELIVAEAAEEAIAALEGVDFLVVDSKRRDFPRILRCARLSPNGAVLVRKNVCLTPADFTGFRWDPALGRGTRVVRSVILPVGKGIDIAYIGGGRSSSGGPAGFKESRSRWIRHVDHKSGEVHVFRGYPRKKGDPIGPMIFPAVQGYRPI